MAKSLRLRVIKVVGYIPIILCCMIGFWSCYVYNYLFCHQLLEPEYLATKISLMVVFNFLFVMFLWSYYMVVTVHPGTPRQAWLDLAAVGEPEPIDSETELLNNPTGGSVIETDQLRKMLLRQPHNQTSNPEGTSEGVIPTEQVFQMLTVKEDGNRRYCRKCNFDKPDRCHHCSVYFEDGPDRFNFHLATFSHCPWINNCVGYFNQKFFLQFITYSLIFCLFTSLSLIPGVLRLLYTSQGISIEQFQVFFLVFVTGLFGIMLLFFVGFHLYLVLGNRTTIENLERTIYKVDNDLPTASIYLNVFDIGSRRNIEEVMGKKVYQWFLPIRTTTGTGVIFPLSSYAYSTLSATDP